MEDYSASTLLLTILLKGYSREILEVRNGDEAVEVCKKHKGIDLITMDLQIAGNGFEATRQIRKFNRGVVIIAQSAYAMAYDKEKALYVGCKVLSLSRFRGMNLYG